MKKTRTLTTAFLILALLLCLQACAIRPLTAPVLLAQMRRAVEEQNAAEAEILIETKAQVSYSGMDFSLPMKIKMSGGSRFAPYTAKMNGTVGSSILGVDVELPVEIYASAENEQADLFFRVDNGAWSRSSLSLGEPWQKMLAGIGLSADMISDAVLYEGTTLSDGRECRRIDVKLQGKTWNELFGKTDDLSEKEQNASSDGSTMEMSLYIDAETMLPVHISARTDKSLKMMEYTLNDLKVEIAYSRWGAPESIEIPPEARNAASAAETAAGRIPGIIY